MRGQSASDRRKRWNDDDRARLEHLVISGRSWPTIGEELGRSADACKVQFHYQRREEKRVAQLSRGAGQVHNRAQATAAAAAAREFRLSVTRSITAEFFGDPLPGRSALDQRQQQPDVRSISLAGGAR